MRALPIFEDQDTRDDILDHVRGFAFDRATLARNDEPMRTARREFDDDLILFARYSRRRSVRR